MTGRTTIAIRAEGLAKRFGATQALDGVDLTVPAGTVLGLLGPNGSGKTTVVRILATLLAPDAGRASVAGHDLGTRPMAVRAAIGLTGQDAAVDEHLTGRENLELIGALLELPRAERRARAAALLERMGVAGAADRAVRTWSGGMRRRLDLAASLVGRPRVLFLDEPTTGLDPASRHDLWAMVRGLVAEGTTVLLTTQYLEEADQLADAIVVLDRGRVIAEGTSDQLKARAGGQVLQVRPASDLDATARVLAGLAGTPQVDAEARLVTLPAADAAVLTEAVRRLDAAGVAVADLTLRRPSLDDVFLRLVGHTAAAGERAA
ncbi:MAG TPA: ATP-binding cassette domain-containing protein [Actinomycetes bacterium]|jgi:oleandomycin transport system ATP-binding protein|nr:ATP-binding cassette domain-containing protein [Actinomycetes bacterium]